MGKGSNETGLMQQGNGQGQPAMKEAAVKKPTFKC